MAEAHGKFTGEPGVAMVTRGPGAANAYVAIHAAWQDATPMVLFVGLIPVADRMRESFQEFDPNAWFGTQAKRVFVLDEASRASEVVAEAFFAAKSGRPGPVIVGLPEDVITHEFTGALHPTDRRGRRGSVRRGTGTPHHGPGRRREALPSLSAASAGRRKPRPPSPPLPRPTAFRWSRTGAPRTESRSIPRSSSARWVTAARRGGPDLRRSRRAAGHRRRAHGRSDRRLHPAAVPGCHEYPGQHRHLAAWTLRRRHRHILAQPCCVRRGREGPASWASAAEWDAWRAAGRADRRPAFSALPDFRRPAGNPGRNRATWRRGVPNWSGGCPQDAVYSFGAGNHCAWAQRYMPTNVFPSQLGMRNGSMGYSVPGRGGRLPAKPRSVWPLPYAGDGEFLMNGQEFATAVQYGAAHAHHRDGQRPVRHHPRPPGSTTSRAGSAARSWPTPISPAFARAFGGHGETVTSDEQAADRRRTRPQGRAGPAHPAPSSTSSPTTQIALP